MIRVTKSELIRELIETPKYPIYTSGIINITNKFARGTVPSVVGQLTELIKECPYKSYEGWKKWYLETHPEVIQNAIDKIMTMLPKVKDAMNKIDESLVKIWVEDLVLAKTFIGLNAQEAIIKKIAKIVKKDCRLAIPKEESKGIDGFIGDIPVSVKPITYKQMKHLGETIDVKIIFYEKTDKDFIIDADEVIKHFENQTTIKDAL